MKRLCSVGFLLAASLLTSGCLTTEAGPADDPMPTGYRTVIAAQKRDFFKDPDSVRDATISTPRRAIGPSLTNAGFVTPWIVCVSANAKNSYGGYAGKQLSAWLFTKNQFVGVRSGYSSQFKADQGEMWCSEHRNYEPFPELML
jgi:hypothetical protein